MKRRLQGLCLLLLGALLGWSSGGDLRLLVRTGGLYETLWVSGKLLLALGVIFVGLVFLIGWPTRSPQEPDPGKSRRS